MTPSPLDPTDWEHVRRIGHLMIDDMLESMRQIEDRPVWQPVPDSTRRALCSGVPRTGQELEETYREFREHILPYSTGNTHPRFWGWVTGAGGPVGMLADMLASGMNPHVGGYDQSASLVEREVLRWFAELFGLPNEASGIFVSGGTVANLIGLNIARFRQSGYDVREQGVDGPPMRIYASKQTHDWLLRAVEILGLGRRSIHWIDVDREHRIDPRALREAIRQDRSEGQKPIAMVGNAGTVNAGAFDDLPQLAQIAKEESIWFHVDGAFGALVKLSPKLAPLADGLEQADSVAFDLHKWGSLPYEIGAALVRDPELHRAAFASNADYLAPLPGGLAREPLYFADRGIQLSRGFRALKAWMTLKTQGVDRWAKAIEQNVEQVARLVERIDQEPELQRLGPSPLNIVCLRYVAADPASLDQLNRRICVAIQESGVAIASATRIDGQFAIRVAHTNHRSSDRDFELFLQELLTHGRRLKENAPC